jgi:toxin FitB
VIVLDTNVISELIRNVPDPGVLSWLDELPVGELATTAVTAAELRYGVARLPSGHRKRELTVAISGLLNEDFYGKVLPFDERAAIRYADIVASRERAGRPMDVADAQIAAICRDLGATLATRNTADFEETGIPLIDPWEAAAERGVMQNAGQPSDEEEPGS